MTRGLCVGCGAVLAGDLRDGLPAGGSDRGGSTCKLTKEQAEELALIAHRQLAELLEKFYGIFAHEHKLGRSPSLASSFSGPADAANSEDDNRSGLVARPAGFIPEG